MIIDANKQGKNIGDPEEELEEEYVRVPNATMVPFGEGDVQTVRNDVGCGSDNGWVITKGVTGDSGIGVTFL